MLFNENDYKNLYKQWFGGHISFYLEYWVSVKMGESHDYIMHRLQRNAVQVLHSCRIPISTQPELRNQTMSLLLLLKNNDFALEMTWFNNMPYYEAVKHLIQCNLLIIMETKAVNW